MSTPSTTRSPNRLAREASAYLRQHAHNPVDWYPWGDEAFDRARREDKPLLVSIGYSACHWCHVMERESFDDEATALVMNTAFVNVKVDREERPDVDQIYQTVVQLMQQSGGWPLTVFLTPDGRPFFAGTYFPPERRYGMPSFVEVLNAVSDAYTERRGEVDEQAAELAGAVARVLAPGAGAGGGPGPDLLGRAAAWLAKRFDDEHGGFGGRPKFPNPMGLELLLRHARAAGDPAAAGRVRKALDAMRAGGLYDHLGGGFHRYSTDERWLVPHFEKMLYDNALLLRLYVDAGRALGEPRYLQVGRDVAAYLVREMKSPGGAFYATQDADSEGEEGKFFVWRPGEVADVLAHDPLARDAALAHYGVREGGNFEHTGATVLASALPPAEVARALGRDEAAIEAALERARDALFEAREKRPKPFRDEKLLTCWNALAIGALAELGAATGEDEWVRAAAGAFAHLEALLVEGGRVGRYATLEGHVARPGFLDDQADLANAALDLYEATGSPAYARKARELADALLAHFQDPAGPGFFFSPDDGPPTIVRVRDQFDQATPSGSAMAATALLRLGSLLGERYEAPARAYLESIADEAAGNPLGMGQLVCALDRLARGPVEVVVVGARGDARAEALRRAALAAYVPNRVLALVDPGDPASREAARALAEGKPAGPGGAPVAYVCRGRTCSAPLASPEALRAALADDSKGAP
ncbi:MAG TPA: thioredoxin domain-containing protein [Polyangiaceae bacterium]|nr:thioredoxin domain-containing protein [Polyangiaceae bacterium]